MPYDTIFNYTTTLVFPKLLASLNAQDRSTQRVNQGCAVKDICLEEPAELLQKWEDFCLKERTDKEGTGRKWTGDLKNRAIKYSFGLLGMILDKLLRAGFF